MRNRRILLLILLPLLAFGCHTARKTPRAPEPVTQAPEPPEQEPKRFYSVILFEGEVEGVNVNGQLRVAEDSAMWISVVKLIEMGRAMCTPDSLWLHAPLLGHEDALDYAGLKRMTGVSLTYDELQQTVMAPDAEARLARMAQQLGMKANIHITQRRQVEHLSFPYPKPVKP